MNMRDSEENNNDECDVCRIDKRRRKQEQCNLEESVRSQTILKRS